MVCKSISALFILKGCVNPLPQPVRIGDPVGPAAFPPGVPVLPVELPPLLLLVRDGALAQPLPPGGQVTI